MSDRPCDFKRDRDARRVGWCVRCKHHYGWTGYPLIRDARCPDCGMDIVRSWPGITEIIEKTPVNASRHMR